MRTENKSGYDPEVWEKFKQDMRRAILDEKQNISIWDWLNGAEIRAPQQKLYKMIEAVENAHAPMRREQLAVYDTKGERLFSREAPADPQSLAIGGK